MTQRPYYQIMMDQFGLTEQDYADQLCRISDSEETAEWYFNFMQFPDNDIKARAMERRFNRQKKASSRPFGPGPFSGILI